MHQPGQRLSFMQGDCCGELAFSSSRPIWKWIIFRTISENPQQVHALVQTRLAGDRRGRRRQILITTVQVGRAANSR